MGRKSSLTPEQWVEVERRHLIDGESINSLAAEYGVNESSMRRRIKPNKAEAKTGPKPLQTLALEKIQVDRAARDIAEQIAELPIARQQIVTDLAQKLTNISGHLASAAEMGAATASHLSAMAHIKVRGIDPSAPLDEETMDKLKGIAALTRVANDSSEIAVNLLRANKDAVDEANRGQNEVPAGLEHFYGRSAVGTDA